MELFRWRFLLVATVLYAVLFFSQFQGVYGQDVFFPRSVLQIAQYTLCNCERNCSPSEREPESMCFSACQCNAPIAIQRRDIPSCNAGTDQCTCPYTPDNQCQTNTKHLCTFDDGVICEHERKYCAKNFDRPKTHCECKEGWIGLDCDQCDGCHHSPSNISTTTLALGSVLAIVLVVLIVVVIIYYRLGRFPCQKDKKSDTKGANKQKPLTNAYSVSGPIPIAEQGISPGKRPGILPPDGDTGEIENEYAYAAINEYATIAKRDSGRPAVPSAPVPSVSAAKSAEQHYYFKLANDEEKHVNNVPTTSDSTTPTTTTTTKAVAKNVSDCYTKVVRKPKDEKPKPPVSQYDRLDRTNLRPPTNGENGSPSDNEYGTLASSVAAEDMADCKPENNEQNSV